MRAALPVTPFRVGMEVDWGKVLTIAGVLGVAWTVLRFLFLPLIEASVRKILKPELDALADAIRKTTACADDMESIAETIRRIDDDVGTLFTAVRANRDLMLDLNDVLPRAAGVDRREEVRRHSPEVPQIPERRRIERRREDQ